MARGAAVLVTAGCVLSCTGGPPEIGSPTTPGRVSQHIVKTELYSLGGATVRKPTRWLTTPYRGMPATFVSPIVFMSSTPVTDKCAGAGADPSLCTTSGWFPPDARTPTDGVLILWLETWFPSNLGWQSLPGRNTSINGYRARVYSGSPITSCPDGADHEISANVLVPTEPVSGHRATIRGDRYGMVACLGHDATAADRDAVTAMLNSLRIMKRR